MLAIRFNEASGHLYLETGHPLPKPGPSEALIRVLRAGICATDLEITSGYVPGYNHTLGHEFVGIVEACSCRPDLEGKRVVGEINCNDAAYTCADIIYQRNHAPGRSVLGIINRDGCMAQYIALPASNLHLVPDQLTDAEACFAEPLAAACRILEQGLIQHDAIHATHAKINGGSRCSSKRQEMEGPRSIAASAAGGGFAGDQAGPAGGATWNSTAQAIAVVGDGRLGLLVAQVLAVAAPGRVVLFGRHPEKMWLVTGLKAMVVVDGEEKWEGQHEQQFDVVVEASGSSKGILAALALTRPLGTLVLKTTVSSAGPDIPLWSQIANDVVVQEKVLVGSRCGPMDVALDVMARYPEVRQLLAGMLHREMPLNEGVAAMAVARERGVLKVQLICSVEPVV